MAQITRLHAACRFVRLVGALQCGCFHKALPADRSAPGPESHSFPAPEQLRAVPSCSPPEASPPGRMPFWRGPSSRHAIHQFVSSPPCHKSPHHPSELLRAALFLSAPPVWPAPPSPPCLLPLLNSSSPTSFITPSFLHPSAPSPSALNGVM